MNLDADPYSDPCQPVRHIITQAHAAVCDKPGVVHFLEEGQGLGEIYGILEFMPDSYKARWHADATLVSIFRAYLRPQPCSWAILEIMPGSHKARWHADATLVSVGEVLTAP